MMIVFAPGYLNCTICLNSGRFLWQKSTISWYFKYLKDKKKEVYFKKIYLYKNMTGLIFT